VPAAVGARDLIALTLAAQIAVAPLAAYYFGQVSLAAPVGNALTAPAVPLIMLAGALTAVLSAGWSILAFPWSGMAFLGARYFITAATFVAQTPVSAAHIHMSGFFVAAIYILLAAVLFFIQRRCRSLHDWQLALLP
jgi:competence protein ComEC